MVIELPCRQNCWLASNSFSWAQRLHTSQTIPIVLQRTLTKDWSREWFADDQLDFARLVVVHALAALAWDLAHRDLMRECDPCLDAPCDSLIFTFCLSTTWAYIRRTEQDRRLWADSPPSPCWNAAKGCPLRAINSPRLRHAKSQSTLLAGDRRPRGASVAFDGGSIRHFGRRLVGHLHRSVSVCWFTCVLCWHNWAIQYVFGDILRCFKCWDDSNCQYVWSSRGEWEN